MRDGRRPAMGRAPEIAREFCARFLAVLGEAGEVEVSPGPTEIYVNLRGPFRVLPGEPGFRGELGRLVRLYLKAQIGEEPPLTLDINGEVRAHREALAQRLGQLAREVQATHRRMELEPMNPEDRRAVHLVLAKIPGIRSYSVGKGENRRVVIEPAEEKAN